MGSGASRPRPPRSRDDRRRLASFICGGGSSSSATASSARWQEETSHRSVVEERPKDPIVTRSMLISRQDSPGKVTSSLNASCSRATYASRVYGPDGSKFDLENAESSGSGKELSEGERVSPQVANSGFDTTFSRSNSDLLNISGESEVLEVTDDTTRICATHIHIPMTELNSTQLQSGLSPTNSNASMSDLECHSRDFCNSILDTPMAISASSGTDQLPGEEDLLEATSSDSALVTLSAPVERRNGSVLHLDVISISSILSSGSGDVRESESRRYNRRLHRNSLSRHTSRRNYSQSMLFSTEDADELDYQDRWLVDVDDDSSENRMEEDPIYVHHRRRSASRLRWNSRSEVRERLRDDLDDNGSRRACPSGLHSNGACSCYSFTVADTSSARASISRIVMLAEALFEILDEIHRQPVSIFSTVSLPAPHSVVDSLPITRYKKLETAGSREDTEQCYICLCEYEEGDNIRVLPCSHEYHTWCVDKWLKEMHGVCPLCRGDVSQAFGESSAAAS